VVALGRGTAGVATTRRARGCRVSRRAAGQVRIDSPEPQRLSDLHCGRRSPSRTAWIPASARRRVSAHSANIVRFGGWFQSGIPSAWAATGIVASVDTVRCTLAGTGGDSFGCAVLPAGVAEVDESAGPFMTASGFAGCVAGLRGAAAVAGVVMSLDERVGAVATGSTAVSVEAFGRPLAVGGGAGVGDDFGFG
jgi:hypothetical protein